MSKHIATTRLLGANSEPKNTKALGKERDSPEADAQPMVSILGVHLAPVTCAHGSIRLLMFNTASNAKGFLYDSPVLETLT
ncbi:hypothetical protein VM1G_11741 [Cytospora mali]|uniref:Uncharacterized protein n=1 Tax=Cytospora mali TaxID=578113 RepID=A0A194W6J0_CYTMA|nr:hypothetical protein VM1G_11741 [Valsa mali]